MCNMAESLLTKQHKIFQDASGLRIRSHHLSITTANGLDWELFMFSFLFTFVLEGERNQRKLLWKTRLKQTLSEDNSF